MGHHAKMANATTQGLSLAHTPSSIKK